MSQLMSAEKRKYALAMRRVDYGIWGYPISLFKKITLTTREGDDNSTERFKKDFRKLVVWFRKLGYEVEYCGVFELTPAKQLLHWHGLLRIKSGYFPVTRRELGDKWNEIHNAFAVEIEPVRKMAYLQKYINKHMVKDYLAQSIIRNKFLVSDGWMRKGYKEIIAEFKHWWRNGSGELWLAKEAWNVLNRVVKKFCEGEDVVVKANFGFFKLVDGRVDDEIYEGEEQ